MKYDIFISYRHRYTADKAEHLLTLLENNGFRNRVSFDKDNLNERFDLQLIQRIDNCLDFIIVLSEDTFSSLIDEDADKYIQLANCSFNNFSSLQSQILPNPDFTRLELARAIVQGKNIIPIAPIKSSNYDFDRLKLPKDIQNLTKFQAIFYDSNSSLTFQDVIDIKLLKDKKSLLRSKPARKLLFSWKILVYVLLLLLICFVAGIVWFDYSAFLSCKSIYECNEYLSNNDIGLFAPNVKKKKQTIEELFEFNNCNSSIKELVSCKDYTHLSESEAMLLNSILSNMVWVQGGKYKMGADEKSANSRKEIPLHEVVVEDFYIGKFEVSSHEWYSLDGICMSDTSRDSLDTPITNISWNDVFQWIKKLNTISKLNFSIPHEEEWEYAARGGIESNNYIYSGSNNLEDIAWTQNDSLSVPKSRQRDGVTWYRQANELGIYNMSGNVAEMCINDFYYYDSSKEYLGTDKVIRGGSFTSPLNHNTVSFRDLIPSTSISESVGFRLILKK